MPAPQSPPCAPNRGYPSLSISSTHRSATAALDIPGEVGRSEKPYPGIDGTTTSNASAGEPPCALDLRATG